MNEENNQDENTVSTEVHYSWIGYPKNAQDQDQRILQLGGDTQFVHAEVVHYEDGSMALKLTSTGLNNKYELMKFLESVYSIAQHDYLETAKENRE